jgi:branched-chain amino acid transport system permease protein
VNGIYGVPAFSIGDWKIGGPVGYFVLAWVIVLIFFLLGRNIARSRYGRALAAVHKDPSAAGALGINPGREKAILWLIAAIPAAIAGSVFAHYSAYIAPTDFDFSVSLLLFTAVVIGGQRSIFGGLFVVVVLLTLAGNTTEFWTLDLMEAIAMIVVYLASPNGLAGIVQSLTRRIRSGLRRRA